MSSSDNKHPDTGRFLPGNSGFTGRPRGARSKLSEGFLAALADDFAEHGVTTIARVRVERPQDYLKIVASLVPRELKVSNETDLTDEELLDRIRRLDDDLRPWLGNRGPTIQ